mgnify:CR=1 FL=1
MQKRNEDGNNGGGGDGGEEFKVGGFEKAVKKVASEAKIMFWRQEKG